MPCCSRPCGCSSCGTFLLALRRYWTVRNWDPASGRLLFGTYAPAAAIGLALLLVFGLMGGWLLAGRMDEFRELADAFDSMLARRNRQHA